ncbi:MAG: RNA 2',3'-cyclic phosphodiesterase [Actinomycetota bacterium]|nr:RNA 2',3'-cyclic phosphodiesterase [Actinomycetota bacterium]
MRLFVALDLPSQPVAALQDFAATAARDGLRLLPPESLHVTLAFLGEQPDPDAVADALRAVAPRAVPLGVGEPAWLPPRRPRVLAVDLDDPDGACARLAAEVVEALRPFFTPERRAFRPHVTVARVRKGARVDLELPPVPGAPTFAASALTLYRSLLGPQGARYDALARTPLT